jgi:hypothetical protein
LSINLESLPIGQMVFAGNKAERDAKSLKSLKKWFDISPSGVTRSEAGKTLPAFGFLKLH